MEKKKIRPEDLVPNETWGGIRTEERKKSAKIKLQRRISVGPHATFYFENYDTMLRQVQEMLFIEKGGNDQLIEELEAYNPLIPQGQELVATLMFEIEPADLRRRVLARLGGAESTTFFRMGHEVIKAQPEQDTERTTPDGKTSAVHFLHFPFTRAQIDRFRQGTGDVLLGFGHENYGHVAAVPDAVRNTLAKDFD